MTNPAALVRTLVTYAVSVGLAVTLGYLLATPTDFVSFFLVALVLSMLLVPLLLRWHHAWLVLTWNMAAMVFVLPGRPTIGTVMIAISMLISLLQHAMSRNFKFVPAPAVARPLFFLTAVVVLTAWMTGGGLAILGSSSIGGKRYVSLLLGVVGFFALATVKIPVQKARRYVAMFFLSSLTLIFMNLAGLFGPAFRFLYYVFPIDTSGITDLNPETAFTTTGGVERMGGLAAGASSLLLVGLAYYGVRDIFDLRRPWRFVVFVALWLGMLVGGYRSVLVGAGLTYALVFWFEGLMRSRLLPFFTLTGVLCAALLLPFAGSLPYNVQRTMSFLPLVNVKPEVRMDVEASNEWRLEIWKRVLQEVPRYFWVGKGLSIDAAEFAMLQDQTAGLAQEGEASEMAGDYHSGPLSLIVPFGICGVIGFIWFLWASISVMHKYYRYGDPALRRINTLLLSAFICKLVVFIVVFGSFYSDLLGFTGLVGLSVALNGPVPAPARMASESEAAPAGFSGAMYAGPARQSGG